MAELPSLFAAKGGLYPNTFSHTQVVLLAVDT